MEHVFSAAIGGTLTISTVCRPCNSRLGAFVDPTITEHWAIQLDRLRLRLTGNSGAQVNPLRQGVLGDESERQVHFNPHTGESRLLPKVVRHDIGDGQTQICVSVDARSRGELPKIINKILRRAGQPARPPEELLAAAEERQEPHPPVRFQTAMDVCHFRRGLAKIIYELAYVWLGEPFLSESSAQILRTMMFDKDLPMDLKEKYLLRGAMNLYGEPIFGTLTETPDHLIGALIKTDERVSVYIRLFNTMEALVGVSEDSARYAAIDNRFLAISARTGEIWKPEFAEGLQRFCRVNGAWT